MNNLQEILNKCQRMVSMSDVYRNAVPVLYIDGTSCTKKSSTLALTGHRVDKLQRNVSLMNINSFGPSMLGYICSGLVRQYNDREPRFNDRSPLNSLEWCILWKLMDLWVTKFGNQQPRFVETIEESVRMYVGNDQDCTGNDIHEMVDFTRKFDYIFVNLYNCYYYKHFRSQLNTLVFIDSDVNRCSVLHRKRAQGSDMQRSTWKFYTVLQNRMYSILYRNTCIDLAWFDTDDDESITVAISTFIVSILDFLIKQSELRAPPTIDGKPIYGINVCVTPPLPKIQQQQQNGEDLHLLNTTAHVYRMLGRIGCRAIVAETDYDKLLDSEYIINPNLIRDNPYIPKHCSIELNDALVQNAKYTDPQWTPAAPEDLLHFTVTNATTTQSSQQHQQFSSPSSSSSSSSIILSPVSSRSLTTNTVPTTSSSTSPLSTLASAAALVELVDDFNQYATSDDILRDCSV